MIDQPTIFGLVVLGIPALAGILLILFGRYINWDYDKENENPYRYCPKEEDEW
jgi:hypothetical protein